MSSSAAAWRMRPGAVSLVSHVLLNSFNTPLLELAKVNGKFPFDTTLLALLIETIKLSASLVLLSAECGGASRCARIVASELSDGRTMAKYCVPAMLYAVLNNLSVLVLLYVTPVEAVLLGQLRVVFTAALSAAVFRKAHTTVQVASLVLLVSGSVQLQLPPDGCDGAASGAAPQPRLADRLHQLPSPPPLLGVVPAAAAGYVINALACAASAAASVANQALLRTPESIHLSNVKLYSVGVAWCAVAHIASVATAQNAGRGDNDDTGGDAGGGDGGGHGGGGLTLPAVLFVANMSVLGLVVSHLLKHLGAVVKLFSAAASACLVVAYSHALDLRLGTRGHSATAFGAVAIFCALFVFVAESERVATAAALPSSAVK